ncbi:conserved hypothetical protein [Beggiatoa sp. PS]|nr:conserved hypothetical protein [Beggiatoa sp. PS]
MLDGLEISVVNLSEVFKENETFRFDSEFFQKHFLENAQLITSNHRMREFLSSESFVNIKNLSLNKNFNYLEISNVSLAGLGYTTNEIDYLNIPDRATYVLKNHDIVISTVRPNRNAVALIRQGKRLVGTSGFTVLRIDKLSSYYVFAFCKTKYFITHLMRKNTATMYPAVSDNDVLNSIILVPSATFQAKIESIVKLAYQKLEKSQILYTQAESLLLQELGLDNWQPPILETTELKLSQILEDNPTFRIDSEYFQTKYLHNIRLIKSYPNGSITLGEVIKSITGGATPLGANYFEKGIPFLRVQNIKPNYIDDSDLVYISKKDDAKLKRSKLKENDVLFSITGSYGNAAVVTKEFAGCNINQHSVKLTLTGKTFSPYFFAVFLNSRVGRLQSDKYIVGITRPALDYESIKKFEIPLVPYKFQRKIEDLIKAAYKNSKAGKMLLELAKHAVELAIEQGEEAAMAKLSESEFTE